MHCVDMERAIGCIAEFVRERTPRLVITLGSEMVMHARHDRLFRDVACGADLLVPDSIGVVWAARRQGYEVRRVPGIEMLARLVDRGQQARWRFFFLGGAPGVADEAVAVFKQQYPDIVVAGSHHGYFKDDGPVIEAIRAAEPDILVAALGFPRQEIWCHRHAQALGVPVSIGVGGSLDVLAGRINRAPRWMQRVGLEWLYRLYLQPSRARRMLVLPQFVLRVLLERQ